MSAGVSPSPQDNFPAAPVHVTLQPADICGYPVERALPSSQAAESDFVGRSYLAAGPGGRGVVLKPLDRDCVLKRALHPSIKERLTRVRELALTGVANLYGVEREIRDRHLPTLASADADAVWLIWEYVQGQTLLEYASDPGCTPRKLASAARELVLLVDSLHRQGIVHGALRPSNAIIDSHDTLRLTHVSPLLYSDPNDDIWGLLNTLEALNAAQGEENSPLSQTVADVQAWIQQPADAAPAADAVLKSLASSLAGAIEARERIELSVTAAGIEKASSRRSLIGAFLVLVAGGAMAWGIWWVLGRSASGQSGWLQSVREGWR